MITYTPAATRGRFPNTDPVAQSTVGLNRMKTLQGTLATNRHGTTTMYKRGCRCAECTKAATDYQRDYSQRRKAGLVVPAPWRGLPRKDKGPRQHGEKRTYDAGCRCEICVQTAHEYWSNLRQREAQRKG